MGTISSGVGLISGLNSKDIIDQLMAIESKRTTLVQARIDALTAQKTAFTDVSTRLFSLQISAQSLQKPSFFQSASTTSSNEDVLTATADKGAAAGSYQFQVARLVTSHQSVTRGFANTDTAKVGAGTLTIEMGGGEVTQENQLADLRGGAGVARGKVRVTDMTGANTIIDLSDAVSLDDVIKKFNTNVDVNVKASIQSDRLVITDQSGGLDSDLIIQDVGENTTAADLGIAGSNILGQVTGSILQTVGRDTRLAVLNDGNGVANRSGADFKLTFGDTTSVDVDLGSATTIGQVIDAINTAGAGKVTAQTVPNSKNIRLVDNTGGEITVAALNNSSTAADLGILGTSSGGTLDGSAIISRSGTVLLKSLKGGAGLTLGTISVQNRNGVTHSIDLSGAQTLQTALDVINNSSAGVKAEINSSGNGIQLTDTSGGTGDLVISDVTGTGAAGLGIAGTFDASKTIVKGANLQRKWVSEASSLANYNGGKGVAVGKFKISTKAGNTYNISLDDTATTLGDVISKINSGTNGKIVASINANGDGLLLTDTTGGTGTLTVENVGSSTATDLNIEGSSATTTIDGTFEKSITISASDTLQDVQSKLTDLGFGVSAAVMNDGSSDAPYRLSIASKNSGRAGRVVFDSGATNLDSRTLVQARDAAVFVGSTDGDTAPLLITSSTNTIKNAVKGVTIDLHSVSDQPVTVGVTRDATNVVDELTKFAQNFNDLADKIAEYTKFDTSTLQRGILLGDSSIDKVQQQMYAMLNTVVPNAGKYRIFADIGITIVDGGHIAFDSDKFNTAYGDDPQAVESLFSLSGNTIASATKVGLLNSGNGVTTAGDGVADFQITTKDGSVVPVSLGSVSTLGDILSSINSSDPTKLNAEILDDGRIRINDLTTGTGVMKTASLNGSQALFDIGLSIYDGKTLFSNALTINDTPASSSALLSSLNDGAGVRTAGAGTKDMRVTLKDGTNVDVSLNGATTLANVITRINAVNSSKLLATVTDDGRIKLSDLSTGAGNMSVTALNGSAAITDLGLASNGSTSLSGRILKVTDNINARVGGLGLAMQQNLKDLIDPVDGVLTQTNKTIDQRTQDYQDRITQLNALLDAKRLRLETQFNNLESSLAKLQTQQQSLGSLSSLKTSG